MAEHLIAALNKRQVKRMPMIYCPTIGAAIARYWFLRGVLSVASDHLHRNEGGNGRTMTAGSKRELPTKCGKNTVVE